MSYEANTDPLQAKILIVDDEPANVKLLEGILEKSGYTNFTSTTDPTQVAGIYQAQPFDLILLDINMPKMDGYAVMEQLKNLAGNNLPPILILTAQHSQEFRQRALEIGARDYVTKPFNIMELVLRVKNLLEVQLAHKYMSHQNEILNQRVAERTHELQEAHEQLHASRLQIVQRLGRAAEYRDNETGLHIIRMSKIAALLGRAVGMSDEECDLLLNAAPMHDIGKIGIPDNILLKQGKLEPHEFEIIKTHSQIGADILSGDHSDLLSMAHDIALTHHEKWDGSGYPNGLKGEEIPLAGRITAIADVFDALTSERPYKKAWSIEKAVELIKEESGRHFDPALVRHFTNLLPDIILIRDAYAEPEEHHHEIAPGKEQIN